MKKAGKRLFQRLGRYATSTSWWSGSKSWLPRKTLKPLWRGRPRLRPSPGAHRNNIPRRSKTQPKKTRTTFLATLQPTRCWKFSPAAKKEQKHDAHAALAEFDRKQWRQWAKSLPQRAAHIRPGSALFKHLALERWTEARRLAPSRLRNRSQTALHNLRIGIKRFRYIVENFLPAEHAPGAGSEGNAGPARRSA